MAVMLKLLKEAEFTFRRFVAKDEEILGPTSTIQIADRFLIFTTPEHMFWIRFKKTNNSYELINVRENEKSPGVIETLQLKFPRTPIEVMCDVSNLVESDSGESDYDHELISLSKQNQSFWMRQGRIYAVKAGISFSELAEEELPTLTSWEVTYACPGHVDKTQKTVDTTPSKADEVSIRLNRHKKDWTKIKCPIGKFHSKSPELMGRDGLENLWIFNQKVYSTQDLELDASDVSALLNEESNKRRLRLEKAHALAAMTEHLDSKAKRQTISQDVKTAVWQRDLGRCVECDSNQNLEFDHIIPLAMGGSNTIRNLQLLCETCNRRKGASLG